LKLDRDWVARKVFFVAAMMTVLGILLIIVLVTKEAIPAIRKVGPVNLFFSTDWNPARGHYGMLVFAIGTILSTVGALIIGVPLAVGIALFVTQVAPKKAAALVTRGVELLAGIPSIVMGWLGFTLLVPWLAKLSHTGGAGLLAAAIVLAIMIMPTVCAIAIDALDTVPEGYKQSSIGLGATRWQTIRHVTLPAAKGGILVGVILGMGRAMGETMAVALVIGPASVFPSSLTTPTHTLTTKILTEMGESSGVQRSALFAMALLLLVIMVGLIVVIRKFAPAKVKT
jgi:phosphate ABC transporter permease protein PstC